MGEVNRPVINFVDNGIVNHVVPFISSLDYFGQATQVVEGGEAIGPAVPLPDVVDHFDASPHGHDGADRVIQSHVPANFAAQVLSQAPGLQFVLEAEDEVRVVNVTD